eukprot:COSAG06_NODE_48774_length_329_cov_2.456522_1_plen_28_part_10
MQCGRLEGDGMPSQLSTVTAYHITDLTT